jgi:hypothetical protein
MIRSATRLLTNLCIGMVGVATFSTVRAEDALKTINNPGGGQIMYGPMGAQPSVQAAMGYMLRQIHGRYGDRPQVGRLFQDRSGQSLAAFFSVTAKNGGGQRIAGLIMVSVPRGGQPSAAVLTDDAQRFPQTVNPMLQRLSAEWNSNLEPSKAAGSGPTPVGAAASLRLVSFPDNSGSVSLPSGWQLTAGRMGAMEAQGPNGEKLLFGIYIPVIDPTNPQARAMINMETQGGRVPLPGLYVAIPYGTDPGTAFISAAAQLAQKQRRPAPTINITKVTDGPAQGPGIDKILQADVDAHDGKGLAAMSVQLYIMPPFGNSGNWGMSVYQASVPKALFEKETPTLVAIAKSYRVNNQVVQGEVQHQIALSNEYTNAVLARARSSQAAFDQKLAHDRANEDARDKSFQAFDNILLDQSVVQDTYRNARGTISNDYADALVKSNPDRFQYVPTQDYLKGIDY